LYPMNKSFTRACARIGRRGFWIIGLMLAVGSAGAQPPPAAQSRPIRVYLRVGLKTHGPGQHDYPQFLADWSKILTERGAIVDGSLHFPTPQELANIDVMVTYKGDAGGTTQMPPEQERATLEAFLKRGGGLVAVHDTICSADPEWFSTIYGGAKKHGQTNFTLEAPVAYQIADPEHPIMKGMADFTLTDESFFLMSWSKEPPIHVLATAAQAATRSAGTHAGEVVPQIWTYERTIPGGQPFRAFVWMQGHNYVNFSHAQVQPMLLRAIAWAAQAPADALLTVRTPARGGRGFNPIGGAPSPAATPAPAPAAKSAK
ncbi:MAG TPA: ThuA domain-containing protein, partial [Opitutaceae bacterium]|nr:ThuA domain-containing protein [Opitutaceae bacterium]